jgi:hypothetical protein
MNNVGSKEVGVILFVDLPIPTKCEMYASSNTTSYVSIALNINYTAIFENRMRFNIKRQMNIRL